VDTKISSEPTALAHDNRITRSTFEAVN